MVIILFVIMRAVLAAVLLLRNVSPTVVAFDGWNVAVGGSCCDIWLVRCGGTLLRIPYQYASVLRQPSLLFWGAEVTES